MDARKLLLNKTTLVFVLVGAVTIALGGWWLLGQKGIEAKYRTAPAKIGDVTQTVSANGTLNPVVLVNVGTQVSGTVKRLHVDFNDRVKAGQILLELDPALLLAQVRQDEANLTFMNILGCLDLPTSGTYILDGRDVSTLTKDQLARLRNDVIGFVFQGYNLLPRATLADNVALPLVYAGATREERAKKALELLAKVGLANHSQFVPNQISGGQQQRVAIARALINNPRLILADEPTGNLDTKTSRDIMKLFVQLNEEEGITIVLVTHEPDIATYAKRLVKFVDGRVTHDGGVSLGVIEEATA